MASSFYKNVYTEHTGMADLFKDLPLFPRAVTEASGVLSQWGCPPSVKLCGLADNTYMDMVMFRPWDRRSAGNSIWNSALKDLKHSIKTVKGSL